jgi:hypothetical protein
VAADFNPTSIRLSSHKIKLLLVTGKILMVPSDHDQNKLMRLLTLRTMVRKWVVYALGGIIGGVGLGVEPILLKDHDNFLLELYSSRHIVH